MSKKVGKKMRKNVGKKMDKWENGKCKVGKWNGKVEKWESGKMRKKMRNKMGK